MHHIRRSALLLSALVLVFLGASDRAFAQGSSFVFVNESALEDNEVTALSIGSNNTLTPLAGSPFDTGGASMGGGLFAAQTLALSPVAPTLFAANGASEDISVFTIDRSTGALTLVPGSPFAIPMATDTSISLVPTPDGRFLVAASGTRIVVFSVASNGALTPVVGGAVTVGSNSAGMAISPNGRLLAVPTLGFGLISIFHINADGTLTQAQDSPFAAAGNPSCAAFTSTSDRLYVGTASSNVIINGFAVAPSGTLTTLPGSPYVTTSASVSNAVLLSRDDSALFVTNQGSHTVTAFTIAANGSLSLATGSPFSTGEPSGTPCGMALDAAGRHLYVSNAGENSVSVYSIGAAGSLSLVTGAPFATGGNSGSARSLVVFPGGPGADTVGLYGEAGGVWFLRNANTPGGADVAFTFGSGGPGSIPLTGDWNGDGIDTPGLYNASTGVFFLRNSNTPGVADVVTGFGPVGPGILPIVGDWDGDGDDTVGVYVEATGTFFLRNSNTPGNADIAVAFGPGGDGVVPIRGDFDGDGDDTVGIYVEATGIFFLKNENAGGPADLTFGFGPGGAGQVPLIGDFDGDGDDTVGIVVVATDTFFLKNTNGSGTADVVVTFGGGGALPLVGDWNGN